MGLPMPITPFLKGEKFDAETTRAMGAALEMACVALRTGDCADDVKQVIANKIIALAKAGERNPDALCEQVLKDIRTEPSTLTRRPKYLVSIVRPVRRLKYAVTTSRHHISSERVAELSLLGLS
jgi:hypothetical protein